MREIGRGFGMLLRGFGWWSRRPGVMALGLIPAAIVGALLAAGFVVLAVNLVPLTEVLTPFADGWVEFWAVAVRVAVGTALVGGALVVIAVTFTALTLLIGEPFYDRIWRSVETGLGGDVPDGEYGVWRAIGDTVALIAKGVVVAIGVALLGFVPVVGGVLSFVAGVSLSGWLLADELSSRALTARGLDRLARRRLLRAHRGRAWGFGAATQLCFLGPLGAVLTMPAAVAGSTELARSLLDDESITR